MANQTKVVIDQGVAKVIVDQGVAKVIVDQGVAEVITAGTRGPRGPEGKSAYDLWLDEGNEGSIQDFLASLSGGAYTHTQMIPGTVWSIEHNLGFFPNVMSFDSAGTQIVGEVEHIDKNVLTITFSAATGGKAYLS